MIDAKEYLTEDQRDCLESGDTNLYTPDVVFGDTSLYTPDEVNG